MNLAACRSARRRQNFVMRLGCFLVTFAVLASLVLEPPRAKAFAMTSSAVTALAGGFLSACGLTPVVSGMGSSEEVNESVARLIQEYLTAELPGGVVDAVEWLGQVSLTVNKTGKIIIPALVAQKLGLFAQWVAGKYGTKPGVNQVYDNAGKYLEFSYTLKDGSVTFDIPSSVIFNASRRTDFSASVYFDITEPGTYLLYSPGSLNISPGLYFYSSHVQMSPAAPYADRYIESKDGGRYVYYTITEESLSLGRTYGWYDIRWAGSEQINVSAGQSFPLSLPYYLVYGDSVSLAVDVSDTMQEVLDRLTALEEGQSIALDVGATQSMEIQEILQGILDAILAGDLAASAEIVDTAEVPVDPEEPDPPVVPVVPSGLDKLGAALTSRFPFSIPWDVYKGVTLLAAPPKAPYFEVDFMAPIADRVGGWKGSTKIVLDFSEYEIIGQVCRWTSTVGFCLMLASGTKRLIWTA